MIKLILFPIKVGLQLVGAVFAAGLLVIINAPFSTPKVKSKR
jgi:hypothetical protein